MEELSRIEFVVSDNQFELVLKQLPLRLKEFLPNVPRGGKEETFYSSSLVAAETAASPISKGRYHANIRLYMEATLIAERIVPAGKSHRPRLLVTDDYKFFKAFARSGYAEDVLRDLVVQVLRLKAGISVLLAGEIIHGV
jgi:hypothetical protein